MIDFVGIMWFKEGIAYAFVPLVGDIFQGHEWVILSVNVANTSILIFIIYDLITILNSNVEEQKGQLPVANHALR